MTIHSTMRLAGVALLVADLFAGGGGASQGIKEALGVEPLVAINHNASALATHEANHPSTIHLCESIFKVAPQEAMGWGKRQTWKTARRRLDFLWASPDCTHHSRAKGSKPKDQGLRGLAWIVVEWARVVRPRVISVENVVEFEQWGPLDDDGQPIKSRKGETFQQWVAALRLLGYRVQWEAMVAADFGAPTTRKRLVITARCDDAPIYPVPKTHGEGTGQPWETAATCIDWSIPCKSIFGRKKPLAEKTLRRIAEGVRRFVIEAERPFIVNLTHGGRVENIDQPFKTITGAHRGEKALVVPSLLNLSHGGRLEALDEPMRTITGTPKGGDRILVAPVVVNTRNGERLGQAPRVRSVEQPFPTITAQGSQGALAAAVLVKNYGGKRNDKNPLSQTLDKAIGTITAQDHHSLVSAHITKFYGTSTGSSVDEPLGTITGQAGGGHHGVVEATLGGPDDRSADVAAFLIKFYGQGGQWQALDEPMHTIVSKARFGLVTVTLNGEDYVITDIRMRMLAPRELARGQGFDDDYVFTGNKTEQIRQIGNSVSPKLAAAVARAQFPEHAARRAA